MNAHVKIEEGELVATWVDLNSVRRATEAAVATDIAAFEAACLWPALLEADLHSPSLFEDLLMGRHGQSNMLDTYADLFIAERSDYRSGGARSDLIEILDRLQPAATPLANARDRVNAAMAPFYFLDQTRADQNARFFSAVLDAERARHRLIEEERTRLHGIRYQEEIEALRRQLDDQQLKSEAEELASIRHSLEQAVRRVEETDRQVSELRSEVARNQIERDRLVDALNQIYESRAWRAIASLRALKSVPRRWFGSGRTGKGQVEATAPPALQPWRPPIDSYPYMVSVIMPVYNKGATLRESVRSVQAQTLEQIEIVLWDDGSVDPDTQAVLEEVREWEGVTLFEAVNQGVVAARNSAITLSRGRYVCCLDPDDSIAPTYLETAVALLETQPKYAIAYPWVQTVGDKEEKWQTADLDPHLIMEANHVPICAVFRREVFDATGGFSPAMSSGYEDWEFWAHAAELGFKGKAIPSFLFEYRFSSSAADSRDAEARSVHGELADQIRLLHPMLSETGTTYTRPAPSEPRPVGSELGPRRLAPGVGRPLVLSLPWFTLGGADRMVEELVRHWVDDNRTVIVFTTDVLAPGMPDRRQELQQATPYVYNLSEFLPREHWYEFVSATLDSLTDPVWLNVGSVWFYEVAHRLRADFPDLTVADQQFNPIGHLEANRRVGEVVDLTVAAYSGLASEIAADGRSSPALPVYVGIGQPTAPAADEVQQFRGTIGAGTEDHVVLFLGRLSPEKRPDWALALVEAAPTDVRLLVVGDGPLRDRVAKAAQENPNITWLSHLDRAELAIASVDIVVIPSTTEGIPLVALEALALQTPLVATAVGGLPDLADIPGVTLVDPEDPAMFGRAVFAALDSPVRPSGLPERFSLATMLASYDELLFTAGAAIV